MSRKTLCLTDDHFHPFSSLSLSLAFSDNSPIKGAVDVHELSFDYLVYSVGAENNTFGIKGVKEHACFLKEIWDAEKIREKLMDCEWLS